MKIEIVKPNPASTPRMALKPGWMVTNDEDYLDVRMTMFKVPQLDDDEALLDATISFEGGSDDIKRAYISFELNVPSGDHESAPFSIVLPIDTALDLCFNRLP